MELLFALSLVMFLAYANGANDNFKGVATLYGCGLTNYRGALGWATLTTVLGSLTALLLATGLLETFSGKGLVPDSVVSLKIFSLSVAFAAAITVMLATRFGFPISTTHALTGALVGAGFFASSQGVNLIKLGSTFFLPLLLSPFLSFILAAFLYWVMSRLNKENSGWFNRLHFLSAGTVCFARALNDTPKIAAILLIGTELPPRIAISFVASGMALGGLIHSKKIAETLSHRVTAMNETQGLMGNLTTGFLVIFASHLGLPVSTTHVACGSLFGIGVFTRQAHFNIIGGILLSWLITLPVAASLGALSFFTLSKLGF